MDENREKYIQAVKERLATMFDAKTAHDIIDVIAYELRDYEITKRSTEIVQYDDENEKILKSYLACLVVEGKSKGTVRMYRYSVRQLFAFLGNKKYDKITTYDIRAWLASMKMRGCKNTHIRNQRCNISPFFAWLMSDGLIEKNPMASIKPIKVPVEERKALTSDEIDTIRDSCKSLSERAVVEVLLASGLRVAELCNLKLEDVDFDSMTISVKSGKGNKDRTTFINPVAKKHLVAYMESNKHKSEYVFTTRESKQYTPSGIRYLTKTLAKRCGIHIHPHIFRRTLATDLARKGMPIQEIQKLLGHTSIETTRKYIETRMEKVEASYRQYVA